MRTQSIECETLEQAQEMCPWASKFEEITDGYMCFESIDDWRIWIDQY